MVLAYGSRSGTVGDEGFASRMWIGIPLRSRRANAVWYTVSGRIDEAIGLLWKLFFSSFLLILRSYSLVVPSEHVDNRSCFCIF